jgi:hypothetical protein
MDDDKLVLEFCPCCRSNRVDVIQTPPVRSTNLANIGYYISCGICGIRTAVWGSPERAARCWNKRAKR